MVCLPSQKQNVFIISKTKDPSLPVQQTWKFIEFLLCVMIPNWYLRAEGQSTNQDTLGCRATMLQWFWHYFLMREKITDLVGTCTQKPLAIVQPEDHFRSKCAMLRTSKQDWFFLLHSYRVMSDYLFPRDFCFHYVESCPWLKHSVPMEGELMLKYLETIPFLPQETYFINVIYHRSVCGCQHAFWRRRCSASSLAPHEGKGNMS